MSNSKEKTAVKESTVDQLKIAKLILKEMPNLTLTDIQTVIQREQELTMLAVSEGRKVVKKNYLTIYPIVSKAKQEKSMLAITQTKSFVKGKTSIETI